MTEDNRSMKKKFTVEVSTTHGMTQAVFDSLVAEKMFHTEVELNKDLRLRWHIHSISGENLMVTNPKDQGK